MPVLHCETGYERERYGDMTKMQSATFFSAVASRLAIQTAVVSFKRDVPIAQKTDAEEVVKGAASFPWQ